MKTRRLQVRLTEVQHQFFHDYAERNHVSLSEMVRDFIEWLKRRESGTQDRS